MPRNFIQLTEGFFVSPQIAPSDVGAAKAMGVTLIVNNRPDGEEPGQPAGALIEAAANAAGLRYVAIPIGGGGVSERDLDAFDKAVAAHGGPVLAFCRSGTRSTILRALAKSRAGADIGGLLEEAATAGYNLISVAGRMQALQRRDQ